MVKDKTTPVYLELSLSTLKEKAEKLWEILESCKLCPRMCKVNRLKNEHGFCKSGKLPVVSAAHPHYGEEPPISGYKGSGTIFFTNCNLGCIFCQNYEISHLGYGKEILIEELANIMLQLQTQGCHNINLVSPTHFVPQIVKALIIAREKGLKIPLVYNTGGYDSVEVIKILEGIIDIYMPDAKYSDNEYADKYSMAYNYPEVNREVLKEMYRQVGNLKLDINGVAYRGMLIRHLVLPYRIAGSKKFLKFVKEHLSLNVTINIMSQYHPCYKAVEDKYLGNYLTREEYYEVVEYAKKLGFTNLIIQGY